MMLVTKSHIEGFYYKPRIDKELLESYHEGLIAIIPALGGEISKALRRKDQEQAENILKWYLDTFGVQNVFIEITKHDELSGHNAHMEVIATFAKKNSVPIIAGHDIYYLDPDDKPARDTMLSVQQSNDRFDESITDEEENFSFLSPEEIENNFADLGEAIENNLHVAGRCSVELELGKWVFPHVEIPENSNFDLELRKMVAIGLGKRNVEKTEEVDKRIEYELSIIQKKGFAPYFLAVGDLLQHARSAGILTNTRGSAAGSLVSYLCGITTVNPIEYGLPFERFLNPDRPLPPDMDIDIADNRRDELIDYARQKYGSDKVAQIGTFGTMMARGAVRDVARALGYEYGKGDEISKMIPMGSQGFPMTLERAFEMVPELKEKYEGDRDTRRIIDMSRKIEGCARHISVHAAGVVISPTAITDYTPLQFDTKGDEKLITQYDMYSIEEAGLLKFDFLGLRNLSILADTVDRIRAIEGETVDPDLIPLNDKKTFQMLARGETEGTFQLNGSGMTRFLIDLKPSTIHDINAMVALYRPGPMQFIPDFIKRKHNKKLISYLDPMLEPILERTYGILVYQDDLLMLAKDIAGYTWGELDKFRKAVGKKIPAEMAAQKEKFIEGCVSHSKWPIKKAQELWTWIEPFAAYGFNKAHSASYGRLAYQTAYFKANYPAIYMSAILTAESGDTDTIAKYIDECKKMN
ncbi:MAG: DNA polymerase III subunit alpha, partial [Minisyncoccia bacterium]